MEKKQQQQQQYTYTRQSDLFLFLFGRWHFTCFVFARPFSLCYRFIALVFIHEREIYKMENKSKNEMIWYNTQRVNQEKKTTFSGNLTG